MSAILHSTDYPPLPEYSDLGDSGASNYGYSAEDMRAYVDADRAARWQPISTRPSGNEATYLIANRKGQVAPVIDGVIQNNVGTPNDWDYGTNATLWMPLPPAPNQGEAS